MYSKEEAKEKLVRLIDDFNSHTRKDSLSEEDTRTFIRDLFEILGWNFRSDEVNQEEHIPSKGFVDYGFRLNNISVMFVEAKKTSADLQNDEFVRQATDYAWHKATTWAVLTNFKRIRIFNAYIKESIRASQLRDLEVNEYLDNFDSLWLLSKESFETKLIDKVAENEGKKAKEKPVEKQLFEDLNKWRELLAKEIKKKYSEKYSTEVIDEMIQHLLDRLLLIRKIEDEGLESRKLEESHHAWISQTKKDLWKYVRELFFNFRDNYNSEIFSDHELDELELGDYPLNNIIPELYESQDKTIRYNFSFIDADVLGGIYEQYLSFLLKTTAKRAKGEKSKAKRKEQGIYYTPRYIVDYIVKNTLGEKLKECKNLEDVERIKVLDPACGSGSFLIKAFDEIYGWYQSRGLNKEKMTLTEKGFATVKDKIITQNIYGVDLDSKAVELAQLNLLIKTADKKHKLPILQGNIKCGNSLIDDEQVAGDKAFKWERKFKEIIDEGGFDVVIGNPPYIRIQTLDKRQVDYFNRNYESPEKNYDIYILFIEKGFKLLKEGGVLGLILPHKFFQGENGRKIREFIYQNKALHRIVDFGTNQVFGDVATYTCLLFLQKKKNNVFYYKDFKLGKDFKNLSLIDFEKKDIEILNNDKWNFSGGDIQKVLTKIKSHEKDFRSITKKIFKGSSTGNDKIFLLDLIQRGKDKSIVLSSALNQEIEIENALLRQFVYGEDVRRYAPLKSNKLLLFPYSSSGNNVELIPIEVLRLEYPKAFDYLNKLKNELLKRKVELDNKNFYKYSAARSLCEYTQPKIMIPDMLISNRINLDEKGVFYHGPAIHSVVFNDEIKKHNPYFYLGILNSKLFWFFITNTSTALRGNAYRLTPEFLTPFCFPEIDARKSDYDKIVAQVERMLQLNKKLSQIGDKMTDERARIEEEIKRIDVEIDEFVYKIYGITDTEKKIIEENL